MKKAAVFGSALLSLAFAAAASAQTPATQPDSAKDSKAHQQFSSIDTNGDGRVSQAEAKANADLSAAFPSLDADRDTYISESEFGKWKPAESGKMPPSGNSSPSPSPNSAPSDSAPPADTTSAPSTAPEGEK